LPSEAYQLAEDQIARLQKELRHRPPFGLLALSVAITLFLASSHFTAVIDAMNRIYGVLETRSLVKIRLVAVAMTIVQAAILICSLIAIVAGPEILAWLRVRSDVQLIAALIQWPIIVVMLLLSFALTFYVGPDAEQKWEWITPGSVVGTVGLLIFTLLFRVYVQHFADYDKTYGSLGGVMVLMFWFWASAFLLLTAGQMNKVIEDASPLGKDFGRKTDPTVPPDFKALEPTSAGRPKP
jgi:membrane protein